MRFKVENGLIIEDPNAPKAPEGETKGPVVSVNWKDNPKPTLQFVFPDGWNGTLEIVATPTQPPLVEDGNTMFVDQADRLAGNFLDPERIKAFAKLNLPDGPPPGFEEKITFMGDDKPPSR